jgi:hypothetical protein
VAGEIVPRESPHVPGESHHSRQARSSVRPESRGKPPDSCSSCEAHAEGGGHGRCSNFRAGGRTSCLRFLNSTAKTTCGPGSALSTSRCLGCASRYRKQHASGTSIGKRVSRCWPHWSKQDFSTALVIHTSALRRADSEPERGRRPSRRRGQAGQARDRDVSVVLRGARSRWRRTCCRSMLIGDWQPVSS